MDSIGSIVAFVFIVAVSYGLVIQIQRTAAIRKTDKSKKRRRKVFGHSLMVLCHAGFLISVILNMLVYFGWYSSRLVTTDSSALWSFVFLIAYFISSYVSKAETADRHIEV